MSVIESLINRFWSNWPLFNSFSGKSYYFWCKLCIWKNIHIKGSDELKQWRELSEKWTRCIFQKQLRLMIRTRCLNQWHKLSYKNTSQASHKSSHWFWIAGTWPKFCVQQNLFAQDEIETYNLCIMANRKVRVVL